MRRFALRRGRSISWSPPSRRLPVAFTILELLVVVAIIGLLLGILLPSLRNAREQARIAKCLANVRNLLTATHAYFTESDERFPFIVKQQNSWNGFTSWSHAGKTSDEY
jgi:type II secretory pathway pseudopilin PulG